MWEIDSNYDLTNEFQSNTIETMEAENTESASDIDPEDKNVP